MAKTCYYMLIVLVVIPIMAIHQENQQQQQQKQQPSRQSHDDEPFPQDLVFCKPTLVGKDEQVAIRTKVANSVVLVSTLDGQLSAVDMQTGHLKWSMMTGPGSMLSSSISKLEVSNRGQWIRLIPSLEGNLYKLDGQNLEALPVSADNLLSNSLQLADDVMITGGKDNRAYGIDFTTGKLKYICSMTGCQYFGNEIINQANLLVVRRFTNTIRAIDPMTGLEKWNYSVGNLEVQFLDRPPDIVCDHGQKKGDTMNVNKDNEYSWMGGDFEEEQHVVVEPNMKITTPHGIVEAYDPDGTNEKLWKHKFSSPIANTWLLRNGKIKKMNLLENIYRSHSANDGVGDEFHATASLYLGVHSQQYYIQQSPIIYRKVVKANRLYSLEGNTNFPRIQWKPYLATAVSRTPIIMGNHGSQIVNLIGKPERSEDVTALMVRHDSDYPYDGGFYIFSEETLLEPHFVLPNVDEADEADEAKAVQQNIFISVWHRWKWILGIVSLFICNYYFTKYLWKKFGNRQSRNAAEEKTKTSVIVNSEVNVTASLESKTEENNVETTKAADNFLSRYYTDFEPIQRLGKGGFGVVFQARNKIDDCEYAVKRICLPTRKDSREKVKREVKALAKLDHVGIVRYYNAWEETPPHGWQEKQDRLLEERTSSATPCLSSEPSVEYCKKTGDDLLRLPDTLNIDCDPKCTNNNTSKGFKINSVDSGSYSIDPNEWSKLNDAKFHFGPFMDGGGDCQSAESYSEHSLPFHRYGTRNDAASGDDSFIVFENSESGDKKSSDVVTPLELSSLATKENSLKKWTSDSSNVSELLPMLCQKPSRTYLYIQMQLCRKENLKDWLCLNVEPRSKFQVLDFFDQIVSAVEYVHDEGLMHRDLKPSNIFFSVDGTIKVGDFGLVTTMAEGIEDHTPCEIIPSKIHTDQVGTQLYMSPEQIMGLPYNHKVDVFSLGLIFFELLVPFGTQMERQQVMLNVKQHTFPEDFLQDHADESSFVKKLLSHIPEDRPTAADIKQSSLLQAFQPRPEFLRHRRSRTLSMTYSTSSSGSLD